MMERIYVSIIRALRTVAAKIGLLSSLEKHGDIPSLLYLRSLFSIYDAADMARLDLPWWTFAAMRQAEEFLRQRGGMASVFEYGPGASTVWLSKRARRVAYVEHDAGFASVVDQLTLGAGNVAGVLVVPVPCNAGKALCPSGRKGYEEYDFSAYVSAIRNAGGPFDMIVVDGRARPSCLSEAVKHLNAGGIILFDNSHRKRYRSAIAASGLDVQVYKGLAPALPYLEETSILRLVKK
jgi:hypothetical protein